MKRAVHAGTPFQNPAIQFFCFDEFLQLLQRLGEVVHGRQRVRVILAQHRPPARKGPAMQGLGLLVLASFVVEQSQAVGGSQRTAVLRTEQPVTSFVHSEEERLRFDEFSSLEYQASEELLEVMRF